jgi:hypothetical protein
MDPIRIVKLLPGAKPFSDQNINQTFIGYVISNDSQCINAYIKIVGIKELFIECCCAIIGREIGLTIPEPLMVVIDNTTGLFQSGIRVGFGSENAVFPSLRRVADTAWAIQQLVKSEQGLEVSIFDEWINNPDRNAGNILFDGTDKFIFIDHGLAKLGIGSASSPSENNLILMEISSTLNELEKLEMSKSVAPKVKAYSDVNLSDIYASTHCLSYMSQDDVDAILKYLHERLSVLSGLINDKLVPQTRLL